MAITASNFIVVYIWGNIDSEDFANYYANSNNMSLINNNPSGSSGTTGNGVFWQVDGQKVGIQTVSTSEILTESQFTVNIEEPLLEALNSQELLDRNIWGIILGYRVPGGFYKGIEDPSGEDNTIIASTSRLSRIKHTFSRKLSNKLYNRQVFQRFDETDAEYSLIVSRIDGPNLQFAKGIVDKGANLNKQTLANGTFYMDPYSDRNTTGAGDYTDLLLDFYNNNLPELNLSSWKTTFIDPYIDATIPFVENDSFVWSWFSDRATTSFFQFSNAIRTFFYNADYDGGYTIRDENGKRWPYLALNAGYVATAGSMSNPTIPGFLNPNTFFDALLRGATLGEAFYFSVPHLDWTISLFGDPLGACSFPGTDPVEEDVIGEHTVWEIISKDLARSAAYLYRKELELKEVLYEIVDITTDSYAAALGLSLEDILLLAPPFAEAEFASIVPAPVKLLYPANDLYNNNNTEAWQGNLKALVNKLFDFPSFRYFAGDNTTRSPTINEYLSDNSFKVSQLLADITSESKPIEDNNLYDEGWWQFEFILYDDNPTEFTNYHFTLEVARDKDFRSTVMTKDSIAITNWTYEKEKEVFSPITSTGVSSSYIGRKIRYESRVDALIGLNDYLIRGQVYYFRVEQYNLETSDGYGYREYKDIIWT